jgi:hypothetical protein
MRGLSAIRRRAAAMPRQSGRPWPAERRPPSGVGRLGRSTSRKARRVARSRTSLTARIWPWGGAWRCPPTTLQPLVGQAAAPGHQLSMPACNSLCSLRTGRAGRPLGTDRLRTERALKAPLTQRQKDHRADPSRRQLNRKPCTLRMGLAIAPRNPRRGVQRLHPRARMVEGADQLCLIGGATTP